MSARKQTALLAALLAINGMGAAKICAADEPQVAATNVVAQGKGFEIKRAKLDEAWVVYKAKFSRGGQLPDEPRESVEQKLLGHIVDTEILMQKATGVEQKLAREQTEKIMADSRQRFATEDDFNGWLKMMGMTPEQYRARTTEQHACEMVIDREILPTVRVSDEAIKKYYEENAAAFDRPEQIRARQILFLTVDPTTQEPLPEAKRQEKETLAKAVKARVDKGEDFFKLSKEFSEEPWAKEETDGDDLLYARGQMPPEFDAAAFSLQTNQVSGVVKSRLGFHIIRMSQHQPAGRLALADVAPKLKEFLSNEEIKKLMPAYLERLRKEAAVEFVSAPANRPRTKQ